jgi:predicted  nucleic acid-binding Zn-ribbon protein
MNSEDTIVKLRERIRELEGENVELKNRVLSFETRITALERTVLEQTVTIREQV